jgi:hypothetical protein
LQLPGYAGLISEVRHEADTFSEHELATAERAKLTAVFGGRTVVTLLSWLARHAPDRLARMLGAATPGSFGWLVGPSHRTAPHSVEIPHCRFLAEGGPGVCTRICQRPSQDFFAQQIGLPTTLEPDHTTGRCRVTYGASPRQQGDVCDLPS